DQRVIVVGFHVGPKRVEELAATEPLVKVIPVDGGDGGRVVPVLPAGADEIQRAAFREMLPVDRYGVPEDPGVVQMPVAGPRFLPGGGQCVVGDQLDNAGRG